MTDGLLTYELAGAILDMHVDAIFVCDRRRIMIFANAKASMLADSGKVVELTGGRLGLRGCPVSRLDQAVAGALDSGSVTRIALAIDAQPFIVRVECEPTYNLALISVRDVLAVTERRVERARDAYELTTAETKLAKSLLSGRNLEEHAELCGIRTCTVRSHLASILAKTGARRQAEVVARLLADPAHR